VDLLTRQLLALFCTTLVATGCSEPELGVCEAADAALRSDATVAATGGRFTLGAESFVPHGINAYWALSAARRGRMDRVENLMDDWVGRGVSVVRIWGFDQREHRQIHRRDGSFDEAALVALDRVLAAAGARGLRVLVVLSNHWSDFGGLGVYAQWAGVSTGAEALASEEVRASLAFYGRTLATRVNTVTGVAYRDDPAVFGWELVNELRCEGCSPALAAEFLADVAGRIREVDPVHLIGAGDEGFVGEHGVDVGLHAQTGALDWVSVHVWPQHWHTLPNATGDHTGAVVRAVTQGRRWISGRHEIARAHGLPLMVGELGWHRDLGGDDRRALVLGAWVHEADTRGAASLLWVAGDDEFEDYDGYTVREDDHAAQVFCR
jgi:mannan endo-1,4-beta-mannosidase